MTQTYSEKHNARRAGRKAHGASFAERMLRPTDGGWIIDAEAAEIPSADIEKAKKVAELAIRGATCGERNAAHRRLGCIGSRHNLTAQHMATIAGADGAKVQQQHEADAAEVAAQEARAEAERVAAERAAATKAAAEEALRAARRAAAERIIITETATTTATTVEMHEGRSEPRAERQGDLFAHLAETHLGQKLTDNLRSAFQAAYDAGRASKGTAKAPKAERPAREAKPAKAGTPTTTKPIITSPTNQSTARLVDRIEAARGNLRALQTFTFKPSNNYYRQAFDYLQGLIAEAQQAEAA